MRISTLSTQPPVMPATRPIVPPIRMPEAITTQAENQLARMPSSAAAEHVAALLVDAEPVAARSCR